jgi:tRNA A-37 threonylcarbamoyl transferase component Bud32
MIGLGLPEVLILACLGGLLLFVVRAALPRSTPAVPTTGPTAVQQAFAGCALFVLVPAGLLALGVGIPAWQKVQNSIDPPGPVGYVALVTVVGLFLALLLKLFRVLTARPPVVPPRPPAAPPPAVPPPPVPSLAPHGTCPRCGQSLAAGAPQGLCPRCLLHGVMPAADRPSPTLAFVEAYVAPPVEDVARLFPNLEVIELVGQGGMGAVYKARQPALDRFVALKLVRPRDADPTFAERFVREAKAMARLNHPHVVAVYESGEAGGLPFLVMEYVDGVTLRDAMRERKLSPAEALAVVPQICDALEYAHRQGVVHRDVKPENILLGRDGRVKIADFGLAKVTDPAGVSLTGTRQAMGTPHYMAPEQWEKPAEVDHRADIYALGVVLYELLTGELPLGRFDPPSQKIKLDIRLDGVVLRALAKEPDRRF